MENNCDITPKNIHLSFILPVYNVEDYLNECVYSICSQITKEYQNIIEVILVDDGSTDKSGEYCDTYAESNSYISVLHKKNGGLASARNAGLEVASGKYISFIDSDDRIAANSIESLMRWIITADADLCFLKATKCYPNGIREDMGENIQQLYVKNICKKSVVQYLSTRPKFPASACCKLYRKKFLDKYNLQFPKDNRRSEDLGFAYDCITLASRFDVLEVPFYEYRQKRKGSITSSFSEKGYWDLSKFIVESVKKATIGRTQNPKNDIQKYALSFVAYEYIQLLSGHCNLKGKAKKRSKEFLKKYRWVLDYSQADRIKKIKIVCKLFGIDVTSELLNLYVTKLRDWNKSKPYYK